MRDDLEKNTLSYAKTATILGQQEQNTKAAKKLCQNNSLYSDQSCKNNFRSNVNSCPVII